MSLYLAEHTVTVFPFTQQADADDEIIIANEANTVFLSLPSSAVAILTWLAQGKTVGEAQTLYAQEYGEVPDIEDFLTLLEEEGFVSPCVEVSSDSTTEGVQRKHARGGAQAKVKRYHFESLSQDVALRFVSRPILVGCISLIIIGLVLTILDPAVIPPPQVLVFKQNLTLMGIGLYLFIMVTIFFHEMAHLVAAKAAGVPAQLSISHRLWALVAQTDMTGIWMASKRQRYLAVLAGSLLDATLSSLLIILLFAQHRGWISIPPTLLLFCRVALFTWLIRLLWECYIFVRTDFYYVLVILLNCKNLLGDTETFLLNQCARFFPFIRRVDQSALPMREMRVIRIYAFVYLVGRIVACVSLIFITLPILTGYYFELGIFLFRGHLPSSIAPADVTGWIIIVAMPIILQTLGLILWLRSLFSTRRSNNGNLAH